MVSVSHRRFKDAVYEQFARLGRAMSAPKRLELLDLLCQGPRSVEALARQADISLANASQHLKVLRACRLVEAEKKGLYVEYRLADEQVCQFFLGLRRLAESRLVEVEQVSRQYLAKRGGMEPVRGAELLRRVRGGEVTVLDVRPREEYRAGHIPGAVSIPLPELEKRLAELKKGTDIVAYCRGPYCVMAIEAVDLLRARGFKAVRLEEGVPEWRARGFKVATGERPR